MFNEWKHAFYSSGHFFAVPWNTNSSNDQTIGFVENMNTRRLIFFSFFQLGSRPYKFSFWTITLDKLNKLEQVQISLREVRPLNL